MRCFLVLAYVDMYQNGRSTDAIEILVRTCLWPSFVPFPTPNLYLTLKTLTKHHGRNHYHCRPPPPPQVTDATPIPPSSYSIPNATTATQHEGRGEQRAAPRRYQPTIGPCFALVCFQYFVLNRAGVIRIRRPPNMPAHGVC